MSNHGSSADADTQPGAAKTVADILNAAADIIEPEGRWTQGAFKRGMAGEAPSCCGIGAVYEVVPFSSHSAERAVNALDTWAIRRGFEHFAKYNDAPERTQAEVVAALRAAAAKAAEAS